MKIVIKALACGTFIAVCALLVGVVGTIVIVAVAIMAGSNLKCSD